MPNEHLVVIGNGPAGHQAARTLIEKEPRSRVTVISRDSASTYMPHLLPRLIAGEIDEGDLFACPLDAYGKAGIKLRCSQEVVKVDPVKKELLLGHKEIISFSGLIIAVGGRPRVPEPLIRYRDFMLTLKTLEDARIWRAALEHAGTVLMIGGDLTSLALTKCLLDLGKRVLFVLSEEAFWPLRCDEDLLSRVSERLTARDVHVLEGRGVTHVSRSPDRTLRVTLGREDVRVDLIGAFFGLVPDVRFLIGSGLAIDRGILVDETLHTEFEGIYATGDCAQVYHPDLSDYWVSIGHDNALSLGKIAALNLLGGRFRAHVSPGSIFDVGGIHVNTSWWMEF